MKSERGSLGTKLPIEIMSSQTEFALFGEFSRRNLLFIKSQHASLELLGLRPLEAVDTSPAPSFQNLKAFAIDFADDSAQSIMSQPMRSSNDSPGSGKLALVWYGLATRHDKLAIKKILDRNAVDISAAVLRGDLWQSTLSIAPVIAECRRAHRKNRRVQRLVRLIIVALVLALAFISVAAQPLVMR